MDKQEIIKRTKDVLELASCNMSRVSALQETLIEVDEGGKVPRDECCKIEALATACIDIVGRVAMQLDELCLSLSHA